MSVKVNVIGGGAHTPAEERFTGFYFEIGLKYKDIQLVTGGFNIRERVLKSLLRSRGHTRRKVCSPGSRG